MLFQSPDFLGWFLPITVLLYFGLGRLSRTWPLAWLVTASIFFYAWWIPAHLPILAASVLVNWGLAWSICARPARPIFALGVIANLALLAYFKYAWFIAENAAILSGADWSWPRVILPLGISFFTFQQIAFLADCQARIVDKAPPLLEYALFVTFFPQLIAGPIVHHKEMMGQFERDETFRPRASNLSAGLTCFAIGLFKKVVIADFLAVTADTAFAAAGEDVPIRVLTAWTGAIAFTFQIYFDFSGYSDMALGLARIFGINLPLNFASPFKSRNIIEFWRRWHMSLTRFFVGYLYTPMVLRLTRERARRGHPLNRRGKTTPGNFIFLLALPTLFTMFLIGIWHGAGFQFAIFGLMHGTFLVVNHGYRALRSTKRDPTALATASSILLTFFCVVTSLVFFRAETLSEAINMTRGMFGLNGLVLPGVAHAPLAALGIQSGAWLEFGTSLLRVDDLVVALLPLVLVWFLPNTQQWMSEASIGVDGADPNAQPGILAWIGPWRPTLSNAAIVAILFGLALSKVVSSAPTRFLYFNF